MDGFEVAHFAHQDEVRVLAQRSAKGGAEARGVHADFALVDKALLVAVQELDGIFDGNNVVGARGVDAVNHGGERGGLAAARGPRHQRYAAPLLADLVKDFGHEQLVERPNLGGDDAQYHSHVAALLEDVHAEAAEARYAVRHVELSLLLELLLLAVGHHAEGHVQHVFARDARKLRQRRELPVHADVRVVAHLAVQVGSLRLARHA